jgi:hypothetical protein
MTLPNASNVRVSRVSPGFNVATGGAVAYTYFRSFSVGS